MNNVMENHPVADIFPPMSESEFSNLRESIKENGQREPIWLYDNKIIDGRHRYRACQDVGKEPFFLNWDGKESDILAFVIDVNLHRRHLNESQRAMIAAKLANMRQGERTDVELSKNFKKVSQSEVSQLLNVSTPSITSAKKVQDKGTPELAAQVSQGNVAVSTAALIAELPKEEQTVIVAKGEKEILETAKAIKAKKAEERKADPDLPVDSNRERTRTAWHSLIEKMGMFLLSARSESTIELTVDNLNERERSSFFTQAVRLRDNLNKWIEILENKGAKQL